MDFKWSSHMRRNYSSFFFIFSLLLLWSRVLTTAAVTLFVSAVSVGCFASFGDGWCVDIVVLSGFGCFDLVHAVTAAAIAAVTCDMVALSSRASIHFGVFVGMRRRWVFLH